MKYETHLSKTTKYTIAIAFVLYSAYNLVLTALQDYILFLSNEPSTLGASFGIFTFSAVLSRFLSGWIIEKIDDAVALIVGNVILTLALGWYALALDVSMIYIIRALQGFGWALSTVTILTMVSENTENARVSEALGFLNGFGSLSLMFFPVLGSWLVTIKTSETFAICFLTAVGISLVSTILSIYAWKSTPPIIEHEVPMSGFPDRTVLAPTISVALLFIPHGALLSYSPEIALLNGIQNPGIFFSVFAFAQIIGSALGGAWTGDSRYKQVATIGSFFFGSGIIVLGIFTGLISYITSAIMTGFGLAIANIALNSYVSRISIKSVAKGMAVYSAGVDSAIVIGSFATAILLGLGWGIQLILSLFTITALVSAIHSCIKINTIKKQSE